MTSLKDIKFRKENFNESMATKKLNSILSLIGNARIELKIINHKLKSPSITGPKLKKLQEEKEFLRHRISALLQQKVSAESALLDKPPRDFPEPKFVPFMSSDRKFYQKPVVFQEAPTFYLSEKNWDFGSSTRYVLVPLQTLFNII